jgi:hypothetical protein
VRQGGLTHAEPSQDDPSHGIAIQQSWTRACAQEAAADRRRRGRCGASRLLAGATGTWGWGAPFAARITPVRSGCARELHRSSRADAGAVAATHRAAERTATTEQVRRPHLGVAERRDGNRQHPQVSHLAPKLRATSSTTARRRRRGAAATARLG